MKTLIVQQNNKTTNFSLIGHYKDAEKLKFNSAQEWFDYYHKSNCTNSEYPRDLRIKRVSGQSWGDSGANASYTIRMAQNDFNKFSTEA